MLQRPKCTIPKFAPYQPHFQVLLLAIAMVLLNFSPGCKRYPKDPNDTYQKVLNRDTLRVGVIDHPPWTQSQSAETSHALENLIIRGFADEMGVKVKWEHQSASQNFEALENYDLDIVAGGFTSDNPWKKHVGFTIPYVSTRVIVGIPPGQPMIEDLDNKKVAIRPLSGLKKKLENKGAKVIYLKNLEKSKVPVATEDWEIEHLGFQKTKIKKLKENKHIMTVAKGENAMIMHLEDYLLRHRNKNNITERLKEAAGR